MGHYYQIIDGKRYNAALINNANFRVRAVGDGRISLQDAQDLWKIAMDGGRITDVEENTLQYLKTRLNWTEPAIDWINKTLNEKVEQIKSYYQVIDGLRYDRKILQETEKRVSGAGDGRISQDDAEFLLPLFGDFGDVTIVEERTLQYILENFKWTEAALKWFNERVNRISKQSDIAALITSILQYEYKFQHLGLAYFKEEALQQTLDFKNKVSLPDALRLALDNLLKDTRPGSFRSTMGLTEDSVREFLEGGLLNLLPGAIYSEPSLSSFPSPLNGESLQLYWIFGLELFDLTDNIYWILVDRKGEKPTYNYIGGANVEDEWPRTTGTNFFTIEIQSCQEPYPGITVDVQDPNGKYIVGKSDKRGQVRITGPVGVYSIFASDGWSAQSKSFDWDGYRSEQVKIITLDC